MGCQILETGVGETIPKTEKHESGSGYSMAKNNGGLIVRVVCVVQEDLSSLLEYKIIGKNREPSKPADFKSVGVNEIR